jgi:hypothetical protein
MQVFCQIVLMKILISFIFFLFYLMFLLILTYLFFKDLWVLGLHFSVSELFKQWVWRLSFLTESTLPNELWNFIKKSPHQLMGSKQGSTFTWCFLDNAKTPLILSYENLIKIHYENVTSFLLITSRG